ncbi:hypothetical protein L1887_29999 [Cichorium endivia]|nr:hypothetical protein L1887_29999 [Cichorium endivia]
MGIDLGEIGGCTWDWTSIPTFDARLQQLQRLSSLLQARTISIRTRVLVLQIPSPKPLFATSEILNYRSFLLLLRL